MKKALRIIIPILLAITVVASLVWYLFVYDRDFTRDTLLSFARYSESQGNHFMATWFYNIAYSQSGNDDAVAIELAEQYKSSGNYTKAEYTLSNAIKDGGGIDLYIALCNTYVEQDKLLDAVTMLDSITDPVVKEQLDAMRPAAPAAAPTPGFYNQYISVTLSAETDKIYASAEGEYPSVNDAPYAQPLTLGDGESKIYALSIGENGLVSPLSIYGYTVGGVIKEMVFSDSAVEKSIRQILNTAEGQPLYTNELWTIKNFTVPTGAKDLSDLAYMTFLETLTVDLNTSADLSFISQLTALRELSINNVTVTPENLNSIASLPQLKKLTLTNGTLATVEPLARASGLTYLNLSNNTVRDLTPLGGLTGLQELHLHHNAILDITPLASINSLQTLDISHNSITSLAPVAQCTNISWLNASFNSITGLSEIGGLTALKYLAVESNKISNVSALAECIALEELNIASNAITDITKLSSLGNLTNFNFSHNQVKELPAFSKDCALVTIDGSYNSISKLDKLKGLKNLNIVNMDYNKSISSVKPLADCPVLIQVNVYGTKVKDVSALLQQSIIVNYKPV